MNFAIMRCKKLKTIGSVASALQHNFRERETPNADTTKTHANHHYANINSDKALGYLRANLPEKRRKDAVLTIEYVMTASPEWFKHADQKSQRSFFDSAHSWLIEKYGEKNIIAATIQVDETTPHLSAFVIPLTSDGRLSAKEFIGDRSIMQKDQTSFSSAVALLGLERGIQGRNTHHQRVKRFYGALERPSNCIPNLTEQELEPQQFKQGFFGKLGFHTHQETSQQVISRLNAHLQQSVEPLEAQVNQLQRKNNEVERLEKRVKFLENELKPFQNLKREQLENLHLLAKQFKQDNAKQWDLKRHIKQEKNQGLER